jgi:excisionase family DNA binding protein
MPVPVQSPPLDPDRWLTMAEVAARFDVNARTVRRWVAEGALPAARVGGGRTRLLRIRERDLVRVVRDVPTAGRDGRP